MPDDLSHRTNRKLSPGSHHPLGATLVPGGVNFSLFSATADEVWLLLFDRPDGNPTDILRVQDRDRYAWHVFVHGVGPGQLYGYKVRGPFDPARGLRFNDRRLLIDPYAKALTGKIVNEENLLLAYDPGDPARDLSLDRRENQAVVPKAIVVDDRFDWQGDAPPSIPFERLVIYETHLKGFTADTSSKVTHPGTYLGFVEKIPHLRSLGVNAVELLPVQEFYVDDFLRAKGLTNYWGYNTAAFFAPESSFGTGRRPGCQVEEFKTLVRELHRAGIEVILDVVYNHTGEGNELGPTFSFKGIDNPSYYVVTGGPREPARYYMNWTGCGNSVNLASVPAIRLVMDSLRYWVEAMHVDGFRFDLASVLGREGGMYRKCASFFDAVSQDPVLQKAKLIAEPWDLGSYEVGNFPVELVGVERPVPRHGAQVRQGRRRSASGPRLPADGVGRPVRRRRSFRLQQRELRHLPRRVHPARPGLFQREAQRGEPRGKPGRDGRQQFLELRRGRGHGRPGDRAAAAAAGEEPRLPAALLFRDPDDPRGRRVPPDAGGEQQRLLPGQPDLLVRLGGGRAERGHGRLLPEGDRVHEEVHDPPAAQVLHRHGHGSDANGVPDIQWFGEDLGPPRWDDPEARVLCCLLDGSEEPSEAGPYFLFLVLNGEYRQREVMVPPLPSGFRWRRAIDTSLAAGEDFADDGAEPLPDPADRYLVNPRTTVVLLGK